MPTSFERGTAWMMASGWPSRSEPEPGSLREWRWAYDSSIRTLLKELRRSVAPEPIRVFVVPGRNLSGEKLSHVPELIDGALQEAGRSLFGSQRAPDNSLIKVLAELEPEEFVESVCDLYGTEQAAGIPELPGIKRSVPLPLETLRHLEEDLEVLHSRILDLASQKTGNQDDFWRGIPPTWMDLHVGVDLPRHTRWPGKERRRRAPENTNRIIEMLDTPGAGGTTAALRIAWSFRDLYPTVVSGGFQE